MATEREADGGFGRLSIWRDSAMLDDARARERGARFELRAKAESEAAIRDEYLNLLGLRPGEHVLDVGCGTGAVTRFRPIAAIPWPCYGSSSFLNGRAAA